MLYAEEEGEIFLGRSVAKAKHMSDETARIIDQEVKLLVERNYQRARKLLLENMDVLHSMKDALMKYETIDAPQIDDLMNRKEVRPPAGWDNVTKINHLTMTIHQRQPCRLMNRILHVGQYSVRTVG